MHSASLKIVTLPHTLIGKFMGPIGELGFVRFWVFPKEKEANAEVIEHCSGGWP